MGKMGLLDRLRGQGQDWRYWAERAQVTLGELLQNGEELDGEKAEELARYVSFMQQAGDPDVEPEIPPGWETRPKIALPRLQRPLPAGAKCHTKGWLGHVERHHTGSKAW